MRPIAFVMATFVASAPAAAQGWGEYSYPDYAFSVAFPANPQGDTTTYKITDNRSVPTHIYSVRQANVVFSMIVAEVRFASRGIIIDGWLVPGRQRPSRARFRRRERLVYR